MPYFVSNTNFTSLRKVIKNLTVLKYPPGTEHKNEAFDL